MPQSVVPAPVTELVSPERAAEQPSEPETLDDVADGALLDADLLIEDVSIDGMCGVY